MDSAGDDDSMQKQFKAYKLSGDYSLANWQKIVDIINKLPKDTLIDYSAAQIDNGIKIILDQFNMRISQKNHSINNITNNAVNNNMQENALLEPGNEQNEGSKQLLKHLLNRWRKIEEKKINGDFWRYMFQFITNAFAYIRDFTKFSKILFKQPKHEFQYQIMVQDIINSCYTMGVQAIPITLFLSVAWGVITALQATIQLRPFGAEFHSLDLVIVIFFREMALLLGIIVLSARSGSSMIAKIGIMRISDEWNALDVIGIDPEIFLLKPKIIAFIVLMPFLAYISCITGIFGAYIVLKSMLHISSAFLLNALKENLNFLLFISVAWKGVLFGGIIGLICAKEARKIYLNSENIVKGITKGVVYSIFACILCDMIINIISSW